MRLFSKIALLVSALLLGTVAVLSLLFYWNEQGHIRDEAQAGQQALLQNLAHIAQESFVANDDLLLVRYTHWLQKWNPEMLSASVIDPQGHILAHSAPQRIPQTPDTAWPADAIALTHPARMG